MIQRLTAKHIEEVEKAALSKPKVVKAPTLRPTVTDKVPASASTSATARPLSIDPLTTNGSTTREKELVSSSGRVPTPQKTATQPADGNEIEAAKARRKKILIVVVLLMVVVLAFIAFRKYKKSRK